MDRFDRRVAAFSAGRKDQEHELGGIFGPIIQNTLWHDGDAELGADGARPGAGDPFDCKRCPIQVESVRAILPACPRYAMADSQSQAWDKVLRR